MLGNKIENVLVTWIFGVGSRPRGCWWYVLLVTCVYKYQGIQLVSQFREVKRQRTQDLKRSGRSERGSEGWSQENQRREWTCTCICYDLIKMCLTIKRHFLWKFYYEFCLDLLSLKEGDLSTSTYIKIVYWPQPSEYPTKRRYFR